MRRGRIIGVLLLCLALAGSVACNPFGGDKEEVSQQLVEVVRGDLTVSVSGSGNIEISKEVNLAFDVGGRIDKIYVEEGDYVTEGDVLAKLDTDALELALTQAQVALTQAQLAVNSANVSLRTAKHSLDEARDLYTWPEIKEAQADVDEAEAFVDYVVERNLPPASVAYARARLTAAEAKLDAMIMSYDTEEVAIKKMEVAVAEQTLVLRQQSMGQAQRSLEDAQKNLHEATLIAPFGGVVANVYVDEGDVIPSPTMAPKAILHLVDLTTMELNVEVDEIDIPGVELNQRAIIEVDALPDLPLEGVVTFVSLLAKEEAGVILYEVTIGFDVLQGSGIKAGMSVDADIVIDERNNILLVPDRAVKQDSEGNPVVKVVVNEQTEERPVVIGISDGFETEIVEGLNEGEVVVVER